MRFAEVLEAHWPKYVASAPGPIAHRHWRAVEAVLSCRTPRRGGQRYHCAKCGRVHYLYHSCNHRNCPTCGQRDQQVWAARQQVRLLPVPYFLITFTLPDPLRRLMLKYQEELYPIFFKTVSGALRDLCADPRHLGGDPGFSAVLHTWTRRALYHPHIHVLIPAVALTSNGCSLVHARYNEDYFLPERALGARARKLFAELLKDLHPKLAAQVDLSPSSRNWNVQCQYAGRGRHALRYLAAYVKKSAFSDSRLLGYDEQGRIRFLYRDSSDNRQKIELLDPLELIRRWLLHALPAGLKRIRHYGWLSPAAHKAFRRLRFMLGLGPTPRPILPDKTPPCCPFCDTFLHLLGPIPPVRGPPLSRLALAA